MNNDYTDREMYSKVNEIVQLINFTEQEGENIIAMLNNIDEMKKKNFLDSIVYSCPLVEKLVNRMETMIKNRSI